MLLSTQASKFADGHAQDHTPSGAVTAGAPTQAVGKIGIPANDIAASALGSLDTEGLFVARQAAVVMQPGDIVGWDSNGSPVGGTALSGAATNVRTDMDFLLGTCVEATLATTNSVKLLLNEFPPDVPLWLGKTHILKSAHYSILATDCGKVIHVDTDALLMTLPATLAGFEIIVVNDGADGTVLVSIDPDSSDKIMGPDLAGADDTDHLNTALTAKRGDFIRLIGDGSAGWWITDRRGTWASA